MVAIGGGGGVGGFRTQPVLKIRLVASSRPENVFFFFYVWYLKSQIFSVIFCQQQTAMSILECHIFQVCEICEKPNLFSVIFCQLQTTVSIVECHFFQVSTFYLITLNAKIKNKSLSSFLSSCTFLHFFFAKPVLQHTLFFPLYKLFGVRAYPWILNNICLFVGCPPTNYHENSI
jgi:hypothetical protein